MTTITRRPGTDVRTAEQKQEAALLAAFRRLEQRERRKVLKIARRPSPFRR